MCRSEDEDRGFCQADNKGPVKGVHGYECMCATSWRLAVTSLVQNQIHYKGICDITAQSC